MAHINEIARKAIMEELERRKAQQDTVLFDKSPKPLSPDVEEFFLSKCHPRQQEFLRDRSKLRALLCPRRVGKTTVTIFDALLNAIRFPGSDIAYIVPTSKDHAKRLFWDPLRHMEHSLHLGLDFKVADNRVVTKEGTNLIVFGARNRNSEAALRGNAWAAAYLDECKDFGPRFENMVIEALKPGLGDYAGQLTLTGTPGDILDGVFYKVTTEEPKGWSVYKWTRQDNPFLPPEQLDVDWLEENEYKPLGIDRHSPKFRREIFGEWCTDDTERVYLYSPTRNGWDGSGVKDLPKQHQWLHTLGLDLGEQDHNAFVRFSFSPTCLETYITHVFSKPRMAISEIAAYTQWMMQEQGSAFTEMAADTGGYGRGIVTDLINRFNLPFVPADKKGNKLGNIQLMNSDFLLGRIKLNSLSPLAAEFAKLTKRIRPQDKKVIITHSDLGDAALYAYRAAKHFAAIPKLPEPELHSHEWYIQQDRRHIQALVKKRRQARTGSRWSQALSRAVRRFVKDMRRLGASSVTVNGVAVVFASAPPPERTPSKQTHEEEYDNFMEEPSRLREPVYPFDNWLNQKVAPAAGGR